jgi:hypothetical protein
MIMDLLKEYHMENVHATRLPIGQDYEIAEGGKLLPERSNEEQAFSTKHYKVWLVVYYGSHVAHVQISCSLSMRVTEKCNGPPLHDYFYTLYSFSFYILYSFILRVIYIFYISSVIPSLATL